MDRQQQRASALSRPTEQAHHLAGLLEVEAVEGLVHNKARLRGEEPEGQEQAAPVALRERFDARCKHRTERQVANRTRQHGAAPEQTSEEPQNLSGAMLWIGCSALRDVG